MTQAEERIVIDWAECRALVRALKAERNGTVCEEESASEFDEFGRVTSAGDTPCWKSRGSDDNGIPYYNPREEWCVKCLRRQAVHDEFCKAKKRHGGLFRRVQALGIRLGKSAALTEPRT